ncbi:MAG: hypothetical protein NVSMB55_15050 [Mycobacteriales bacterium]
MLTLVPVLLAAMSAGVVSARSEVGSRRLAVLRPPPGSGHDEGRSGGSGGSGRSGPWGGAGRSGLSGRTACVLAGVGLALLVGLPAGLLPGAAVAIVGPVVLARLEPVAVRRQREQLVADLPLTLDLLAACLAGGSTLAGAICAVAGAVGGPCGARLAAVGDAQAVGTPPAEAWLALAAGRPDDPLASAARVLGRAAEGGAPVAAAVARLAVEARAAARAAAAAAAHRLGVLVVAPLGLCFLPAFVLLGVVPVVIGLAGPLLGTF